MNNDYIMNSSIVNYEQNLIANVLQENKSHNSEFIGLNYILDFQNLLCKTGGWNNNANI